MDKVSHTSLFENEAFQTLLIDKVRDIKELFGMVINAVQ